MEPSRTSAAEIVYDVANGLGEGPVWSADEQCLWWVDVRAPALQRHIPSAGGVERFDTPALVGAVALRARGGLLVALKGGLSFFDTDTGAYTPLVELEADLDDNRPNEGRCDPQGRFWLGTMVDLARYAGGSLYRIGVDGACQRVLSDLTTPNSLRWSPDGGTMYFSDSKTGEILAFDFDEDEGTLSNRRVFVPADGAPGMPDGSAVDADGCLWNARYGAGCVARFTPDGRLDLIVPVPVSQVTACTFGGADLSTLYVTSARQRMTEEQLAAEPLAGGLFATFIHQSGFPESPFLE